MAKKHETARPVRNEEVRSAEGDVIFRTPHDQLGQERHRPEGPIRPELSTSPWRASCSGPPRSDHPAEQPQGGLPWFAPQAKEISSFVVHDRNAVRPVRREAVAEGGGGISVVDCPSGRLASTKKVTSDVTTMVVFTSAGKPPPQLALSLRIRSYGLVSCAQVMGATADVAERRGTKALLVFFG